MPRQGSRRGGFIGATIRPRCGGIDLVLTVFIYSLVSRRLETTVITAPILFTLAGMALYRLPPVFSDAARIRLASLNSNRNLPIRLLTFGRYLMRR